MSDNFFCRVNGNLTLRSDYQVANWSSCERIEYEEQYAWRDHYYKLLLSDRRDIPLPIIYKNKMYFNGGLRPIGIQMNTDTHDCIFGLENGIPTYKIVPTIALRLPNDAEYNKYFRPVLESGIIRLITNDLEDSSYISLKGLSFYAFDTKINLEKIALGRMKKDKWRKRKFSDKDYKKIFDEYKYKGKDTDNDE